MRSGASFKGRGRPKSTTSGVARHANCSMLEAIKMCEDLTGRPMNWSYVEDNRIGDHIWWISDVRRFQSHYPEWRFNLRHSRDAGRNPRCDAATDTLGCGGEVMAIDLSRHDWVAAGIPGLFSVVIPARNEAENLPVVVPALLTTLESAGINHEILVVNDGSTDDTRDVLVELAARYPNVRFIENPTAQWIWLGGTSRSCEISRGCCCHRDGRRLR